MDLKTDDLRLIDIPAAPLALRDAQHRDLAKIQAGFNAEMAEIEKLDAGLTPETRADRKRELRNGFHDEHAARIEDMRKADKTAEVVMGAHLNPEAIRARALLSAKPAEVSALVDLVTDASGADLQAIAVEAYRKRDFVAASIVAREVASGVAGDELTPGNAATVLEIVERVPIPGPDAQAIEALKNVRLDAIDGEVLFKSGSVGESLTPIDRLTIERRKESIRNGDGETAFRVTPGDPNRFQSFGS